MNHNVFIHIYIFTILLLMLSSMNAYFLWEVPLFFLEILSIIAGFLMISLCRIKTNYKMIFFISLIPLLILTILKMNFSYFISQFLTYVIIIQILSLPYSYKSRMLKFCGVSFSVILGISLLAWISHLFFIEIPSSFSTNFHNQYFFENHLLFLRLNSMTGYMRFISVFLEPGHVSMICVFFLYAFSYDFKKWYVWILFLSILFSLSLAGYILVIIGYLLNSLNNKLNEAIKRNIVFVFFIIGIFGCFLYFSTKDNILNERIFLRLELDEEKGIVGNNRVDDNTNQIFKSFIGTSDVWLGYSINRFSESVKSNNIFGSGYKRYFLQHGILGTLACFLLYFLLSIKSVNKRQMILFLLLYVIAFIQRAYPFWMAWMLPFLCLQKHYSIGINKRHIYNNISCINNVEK